MSGISLKILPAGILKKKAREVPLIGVAETRELEEMVRAMYLNRGVGLAAVQVGIDKQLAVVDVGNGPIKFINPVIVRREGSEEAEEGCLSVPDVTVKVRRAKTIIVRYLDEHGNVTQMKAEGLLARAIQHEIDHLSGKVIVDYLNPVKKMLVKARLAVKKGKTGGKLF